VTGSLLILIIFDDFGCGLFLWSHDVIRKALGGGQAKILKERSVFL